MIRFFSSLFFIFVLILISCTSRHEDQPSHIVVVNEVAHDLLIPQAFIRMIESDLLVETKILSPVFNFVPLQVLFTEKSSGVLSHRQVQFDFPKGGGRIDLQQVVHGVGSFYVSFPDEQFKSLPELEHLFYVSQAPQNVISDENFGVGCGKWIDLKNQFAELKKNDFLLLNSTSNRHLFVLAGHYVFVFRKLNQIYLTQVTISDSKNINELCPQVKGSFL